MAELVDAHDSKSCSSDTVRVRFSPEAHKTLFSVFLLPFKASGPLLVDLSLDQSFFYGFDTDQLFAKHPYVF